MLIFISGCTFYYKVDDTIQGQKLICITTSTPKVLFCARAEHILSVKKLKSVFSFLLFFIAAYIFNKGMNAV